MERLETLSALDKAKYGILAVLAREYLYARQHGSHYYTISHGVFNYGLNHKITSTHYFIPCEIGEGEYIRNPFFYAKNEIEHAITELVNQGLIKKDEVVHELARGKRRARHYTITDAGIEFYRREIAELILGMDGIRELSFARSKIDFGASLSANAPDVRKILPLNDNPQSREP